MKFNRGRHPILSNGEQYPMQLNRGQYTMQLNKGQYLMLFIRGQFNRQQCKTVLPTLNIFTFYCFFKTNN